MVFLRAAELNWVAAWKEWGAEWQGRAEDAGALRDVRLPGSATNPDEPTG